MCKPYDNKEKWNLQDYILMINNWETTNRSFDDVESHGWDDHATS